MRPFPRTASRRVASGLIAIALAAGAVSVPVAQAEDLKDRQRQVQRQIKHADHALEESSGRLRRATAALEAARASLQTAKDELGEARTKLAAARVRDQEMKLKLAEAEAALAQAEADLVDGREALDGQRVVLTDTITDIYQQGDPQLLAISSLLEATSPADLTRGREMQNAIVGRENHAYDDLHAAEVLLEVREDQVADARDEVEVQRRAAAAHLLTMRDLHADAQAARARVRELVHDRRDARQNAREARQKDRAQLLQLRKQERRIRQRILEAARRAARSNQGGYHGSSGGFLSRPVPGIVTSPYGFRIHPIYHYRGFHNGTDFRAPCGTPMRAPANGRVISRYWSSVYGHRLFIGLGMVNGRYLTAVFNHASGYRVGVGATVRRGQVIGYSGSTGWSTGCHLHFEVLAGGQHVDPMNWL